MFLITAFWRKSRQPEKPGTVSIRLIDDNKHTITIALGFESTKEEIFGINKARIEEAMNLAYLIAEKWTLSGREFSIYDVAGEFIRQYANPDNSVTAAGESPIVYNDEIARFGRGFMTGMTEEMQILPRKNTDLLTYIDYLTNKFKSDRKLSTSRNIRSTGLRIAEFLGDEAVRLCDINSEYIDGFNNFLSEKKLTDSTVSFYMRTLKLILFQARNERLIEFGEDWFEGVNVHIDKSGKSTIPKALPINVLRYFADYDFSEDEQLAIARDVFMFCFYMNGMEWNDAVLLSPQNIMADGYVVFNRRQKGSEKEIRIGDKARAIINKYLNYGNEFLFPVAKDNTPDSILSARNSSTRYLKIAGKRAGISNISFNRARSTWLALTQQTNIAEQLI